MQRNELAPERILVRVAPVDERQQVRRHAHAHRRALEALLGVGVEVGCDQVLNGGEELGDVGDGVLRLPAMIEELLLADRGVGGDLFPERAVQELFVEERVLVDGRPKSRNARRYTDGATGVAAGAIVENRKL